MALYTPVNLAITTLGASFTAGATTVTLVDGSRFDTGGGWFSVEKNNVWWHYTYTSRSGNTLSGVSYLESSSGVANETHASGSTVFVDGARYVSQLTALFDSSSRLKHEYGGLEADISAIGDGDMIVGTGTGTVGVVALTHADGAFLVSTGTAWTTESGSTARTSLGLAIGTDVQAYNAKLAAIAALATTDGGIIVGDGSTFVLETTTTLRTSIGVGTGDTPSFTGIATSGQAAVAISPYSTPAGSTGELRFLELAAGGTAYTGFKAPDALAASVIYTLPSADGTSGYFLSTNGSGVLSWATGAGIASVAADTSPDLGGNLNVATFHLVDANANELLKFSATGSAVNEFTITNEATGNAPILSATGGDTNINFKVEAKGSGHFLINNTATGNVGIGTTTPDAFLDIERTGAATVNTNFILLTNKVNAASMTDTATSIEFSQYYYDPTTPAIEQSGRITVSTEGNWTSTSTTRDSYMSFSVSTDGALLEKLRITSAGRLGLNTSSPASTIHIIPAGAGALQIDPYGTGGGQTGEVRFLELAANGTNYVGFKAADALSGNLIFTLPSVDGSSGQYLQTNGAGVLSFAAGAGGAGLASVEDDTSPTLGGLLDVASFGLGASGGREYLLFSAVASAVNEFTITHAATGNGPILAATGDDTNISATFAGKGTGAVKLGQATSVGVDLLASQPIRDANLNELFKFTATGSAVNEFTIANAATGGNPTASVTGGDTNISVALQSKGTGAYNLLGTADTAAEVRLFEDTDNGTNYVGLKAAASLAGNVTWTLPSADGNANEFIKTDGSGTLSFAKVGIGKFTIWVPAGAMTPTVSNGCAALTSVETTAGRPDMNVLDFDASADEHAQFSVAFPKAWNLGTVTFQAFWTSTAVDTDGVAWGLQGVAVSNDDTIDVAYGTPVVVTDDNISAAEDMLVTAESSAVTIAGTPADDDVVYFRVFRDVSDANDDMTEDARLIGIKLFFTTDAGTDD